MVAIIIIIIAYSYSLWRFFVWILQDSPWFSGILFNYCHFYLDLILKNILETCFGWILSHCLGALWTLWHIWDSSFFRIILSFWGFLEILFDSFFFFWWIEWNCFRWLWILSSFQGFFVMLGDSWGFPFSFLFQRTLCWDYLGFCLDCYELFDTCKHSSRFFWNQREFFRDSSEMLLLFVSLSDLESFGICSSFDDLS